MRHSRRWSSRRRERGRGGGRDLRSHAPGSTTLDNQYDGDENDVKGSGDDQEGREKRARGRGRGEKGEIQNHASPDQQM